MKHSRFLSTYTKDGVVAVFHALTPDPVYLPESEWQAYLDGSSSREAEIRDELINLGLIVDGPDEDEAARQTLARESRHSDTMSILYLVLTKSCNFRCRQCFQPERKGLALLDGKLMSKETAKLAIDQFARHMAMSEEDVFEPQIQLYGGEPLLNWGTLTYAVTYARRLIAEGTLPDDLNIVVVTNGSLMNEEKAAFFAAHRVIVGLSADGPKALNDDYRRLIASTGSTYDLVRLARLTYFSGESDTFRILVPEPPKNSS